MTVAEDQDKPEYDFTLSGDDIALAEQAAALAIAWWRMQPGASNYRRKEIARLKELIRRLSAISCHAYPYKDSDDMPNGVGSEQIMRLDWPVVKNTRNKAMFGDTP